MRNFAATLLGSNNYPGYPVNLPTTAQIDDCLNIATYDMSPWDCSNADEPNTSFRFCLEGFTDGNCPGQQAMHNIVHDWVAGFFEIPVSDIELIPTETYNSYCNEFMNDTVPNNVRVGSMEPLDVSPNDPTFFMHHCNVDKLYANWQEIGDNFNNYSPVSGAPEGYNLNDQMYPYSLPEWQTIPQMTVDGNTPASMLDFKALGYYYQ